jgi:catechol 2,3-dioxygenase-like lactoylglutathione lyase family enzyme
MMRILPGCHFRAFLFDVIIERRKSQQTIKKENKMRKIIDSESVTVVNQLTMVSVVVSDMKKAKEFYAEKLGLKVATDYRRNDDNWWVTLILPGSGASITLARSSTTSNEPPKPGTVGFYLSSSNIAAAHKELNEKDVKTSEIRDDLYGPGSGVKFFQLNDPDGNQVTFAQE